MLLSKVARTYAIACANALPHGRAMPFTGRLTVWLNMRPPERSNRGSAWDIANREKILCDVLTKQRVWLDDSQIDCMVIMRGEPIGDGCVDVLIQEH